ncbi:MAG: hypothetical protein HUJ26_16700 [Planctomycetaceae bacterium]|nr:hypothetical protein [Planctomycetaceae bacterium]
MQNTLTETPTRTDADFREELKRRIALWNEIITAEIHIDQAAWQELDALEAEFLEARHGGDWETFLSWLNRYEHRLQSIAGERVR